MSAKLNEDMYTKYSEVRAWLDNMEGSEAFPSFEVTNETVDHLHKLMLHNKKMDRLADLYVKDLNTKCQEYQAESERIKRNLDAVGLPLSAFSNPGKSMLKSCGQTAQALDVKDVKRSTYILALNELMQKRKAQEEKQSAKKQNFEDQLERAAACMNGLETVSMHYRKLAECSAVDVPLAERKTREMERFEAKAAAYREQSAVDEQKKGALVLDKQISHQNIVRLSGQLKELEDELKPLELKYQRYRSLPPDIHMAEVKLAEMRREIKRMEEEMNRDIDEFVAL